MTPSELQHRLDGTKEPFNMEISPQLDAMLQTLTEPELKLFMGKLWSLQRVYSGPVLYRKVNMLIRATFSRER
jgi:hypothetical protein